MELRKLLSEARWFLKINYIIKFSKDEKFLGEAGFQTPRRERLATDICIMNMLYESSAVISVNGFLCLY